MKVRSFAKVASLKSSFSERVGDAEYCFAENLAFSEK